MFSGAGLNSEESPLPQSRPRTAAACDLIWELFKLLPPIMGEHGAHPGKHITSREQPSLSREGMVALWFVPVPQWTPHALLRRVSPNSRLIWKLLEESLRTTAEGLLEKSFSASWNRTSCYLNHQWARQLFVMTVGFRGPQAPWPASFWTGETGPCLRAGSVWGLNCALFWIFTTSYSSCSGLPRWCSGKEFSYECSRHKRHGLSS